MFESCEGLGGDPGCDVPWPSKVLTGEVVVFDAPARASEWLGGLRTTGAESGTGAAMGLGAENDEAPLNLGDSALVCGLGGGEDTGAENPLAVGADIGGADPNKLDAAIAPPAGGVDDGVTEGVARGDSVADDGAARTHEGQLGTGSAAGVLPYHAGRTAPLADGPVGYAQ